MTKDYDKKNINTATETIKTEIENLQLLQQQFNNKKFSAVFLKVLNEIENCKGRVLFSTRHAVKASKTANVKMLDVVGIGKFLIASFLRLYTAILGVYVKTIS